MINRKISVHLQDFPNVSFLAEESRLVGDMDLIRILCSLALSIRDNKNLRVRLPLKKLTVIGKNAARILPFKEIIAEEVNVKSVEIKEEISDLAELKLQINFKKIGAKFGAKIKEITDSAKRGEWKQISEKEIRPLSKPAFGEGLEDGVEPSRRVARQENGQEGVYKDIHDRLRAASTEQSPLKVGFGKRSIEIAGVRLVEDEFEIKLAIKNQDERKFAIAVLPTNDYLVQLDIEITQDLENEGIARDIVRSIQQNRKDADLNISNHIQLKIFSTNSRILEVAKSFENYIKEQVLADSITHFTCADEVKTAAKFSFANKLDDGDLLVGIGGLRKILV